MHSLALDPSQILALHALLSAKSVTLAARDFGISQSSMSHRLRRLRESLADELLVQQGREMLLTPRAESMLAPLESALAALRQAVAPPLPFDPARERFDVHLALPDLLAPYVPDLCKRLHRQAPGMKLSIIPVPPDLPQALSGEPLSLAIAPASLAQQGAVTRSLGALPFFVVCRKSHPLARGRVTTKRWLGYPHVVVSIGSPVKNVISQRLREENLERQLGLSVPSFLAGLLVVSESDMVMNAPLPLARKVIQRLGLVARPIPLTLPAVALRLMWHERNQGDERHAWVRSQVFDYFQQVIDAPCR